MDTISKFTIPGILLLLTLVFGFWLSFSGKPYNGILFNIHKLIALAAVIVTAIQVYGALRTAQVQFLLIAAIVLTGLCVVALFATGALMSIGGPGYDIQLAVHRVALVLTPIAAAGVVYLLANRA
jgi:hypothetical protein